MMISLRRSIVMGEESAAFVLRARLVRFAAVVADRLLAQIADLIVLRAERARTFGALFIGVARATWMRTFHEAMLHGARGGVHGKVGATKAEADPSPPSPTASGLGSG